MAITVALPGNSPFTVSDLPEVVDFLSTDATALLESPTRFSGNGVYDGGFATYVATGTGFATSLVYGTPFVTAGVIDTITFTTSQGDITFTEIAIDMAVFAPIIIDDILLVEPFGIEMEMLSRDWDITLGNLNDIAPKGTLVGDGATLNLIGDDVVRGRGGDDNLFTGDGNDRLYGDLGNDILNGGRGQDLVWGGSGNDTLRGEAGRDKLFGQNGRDKLFGADGNDILNGGKGRDVLTGGKGADDFVFGNKFGKNVITDFDATNNFEDIDLSAVSRIKGFYDLKNNHMAQDGSNVVIDDHNGTQITLLNVDLGDLHKADFLF